MALEQGVGPINFGTTEVPLCDGLNETSPFEVAMIKSERVVLALCFLGVFILAIYNSYAFLYKQHMYASYPILFSYIVIIVFSLVGVSYEIYMGFRCGQYDCFAHLLVSIMPEYRVIFFTDKHRSYLQEISILWKVRQQLHWGLGVGQIMILSALALKISNVQKYFNEESQVSEIRRSFHKADQRAKIIQIVLSVLYVGTMVTIIVLSFPVMSIISQAAYNTVFLVQIGLTIVILLSIYLFLHRKLSQLKKLSGESFVQENNFLMSSMMLYAATFGIRIFFTTLQMTEVFTPVDLQPFWAIQLECFLCIMCELSPPFYFMYKHLTISWDQEKIELEERQRSANYSASQSRNKETTMQIHDMIFSQSSQNDNISQMSTPNQPNSSRKGAGRQSDLLLQTSPLLPGSQKPAGLFQSLSPQPDALKSSGYFDYDELQTVTELDLAHKKEISNYRSSGRLDLKLPLTNLLLNDVRKEPIFRMPSARLSNNKYAAWLKTVVPKAVDEHQEHLVSRSSPNSQVGFNSSIQGNSHLATGRQASEADAKVHFPTFVTKSSVTEKVDPEATKFSGGIRDAALQANLIKSVVNEPKQGQRLGFEFSKSVEQVPQEVASSQNDSPMVQAKRQSNRRNLGRETGTDLDQQFTEKLLP